jgi:transketolase
MSKEEFQKMEKICQNIRRNILKMTTAAGSGHVTSSLSGVEIMVSLLFANNFRHPEYQKYQKFTALELNLELNKIGCDRFIFSKGHASPLFYGLYKELGVLTDEELLTFRDFDSVLEGHPTPRFVWTEATTGSLGQGLGIGVGLALALRKKFENDGKNSKIPNVFVLLGDSEMAEGSVWEVLNLASFYGLNNLVGIVDLNRLGQTGETQHGWESDSLAKKITSFGWQVWQVNGHNLADLDKTYQEILKLQKVENKAILENPNTIRKPKMIIAKTSKGKGVDFLENLEGWHGKALNWEQLNKALSQIDRV